MADSWYNAVEIFKNVNVSVVMSDRNSASPPTMSSQQLMNVTLLQLICPHSCRLCRITAKFDAALCKRNTAIAPGDLADARVELVEVLPGNANLAAAAQEG